MRIILSVVFLVVTIVIPLLIWGEVLEQGFSLSGVVTWLEAQGRFAWPATIADLTLPIPASAVMGALGQIYGALVGGLISAVGVVSAGMVGYGLCRWLGRPLTQWLVGAGRWHTARRCSRVRAAGWWHCRAGCRFWP